MLTRMEKQVYPLADWEFEMFQDAEGGFYFHAASVCDYFELKNASVTVQRHVDEDWRFKAKVEDGKGGDAWVIKEPGLYQLAMVAKTPQAKQFQKWVYSELLPKLRAEGGYIMANATQQQVEALQEQLKATQAQFETADRKAKLYCDLQGVTLKAFHASLKQAIGPKFKAKVDHFCNVTVDYLIDASVQPWQIDMGGNKLSDYHYPLDAMIVASRQYLTAFEPKAVRLFDEHFNEALELVE